MATTKKGKSDDRSNGPHGAKKKNLTHVATQRGSKIPLQIMSEKYAINIMP